MKIKRGTRISYVKKNKKPRFYRLLVLLPIICILGLLPFMVKLYVYNPGLNEYNWFYNTDNMASTTVGDTFLYWRQCFVSGLFFYMCFIILWKCIRQKKSLRFSLIALPMGIYAVFCFLSSIFSQYKQFCFTGIFEQFENVFVLMGYALIIYYCLIMLETKEEVSIILLTLTISTLLLSLIGVLQTFGFDFFSLNFVKKLISSNDKYSYQSVLSKGTAYLSLYNPNYVGVYVAILFPLFLTLAILEKCKIKFVVYNIICVFLLISLYGSGSKAGFLVLFGLVILIIIFMRRVLLKHWYIALPLLTLFIAVFLLINQYNDNKYIERIIAGLKISPKEYDLQAMTTEKDGIHITYKGETMVLGLIYEDETIYFPISDEKGNTIEVELLEDMTTFSIVDSRFYGFEFFPLWFSQDKNILGFGINIDGRTWRFTNQYDDEGTYYYYTDKGKFDHMIMAEQVLFNEFEDIFSGRGYIWSVTIPLLKDKLFLGSGADTFVIEFPQQDYLRLWRNGYSTLIMSKPHCLYLQVGVQTGVISLIALLTFFIMYGISSIRLYINSRFETFYEQVGVAIFMSVLGFAVMGLTNDSCTAISPLFWTIAGLGVFINSKCSEQKKVKTIS